jgi:hypothetical protein
MAQRFNNQKSYEVTYAYFDWTRNTLSFIRAMQACIHRIG